MTKRIESPHEQVTGVLDDPEEIEGVSNALKEAGFSRDDVVYVGGEEALARVDVHGLRHGVLGRLTRSLQHFGEDAAEYHAAEVEARAGHLLVAVSVSSEQKRTSQPRRSESTAYGGFDPVEAVQRACPGHVPSTASSTGSDRGKFGGPYPSSTDRGEVGPAG